jgi:hypothetical protein
VSLLSVDNREDPRDRLAQVVAVKRTASLAPMLPFPIPCFVQCAGIKRDYMVVSASCGMCRVKVRVSAYILFSLVPDEAIFWMRSWPSSVFSSPRVLVSSSLFFDHSWPALIFAEDYHIVSYPVRGIVNRGRLVVGVAWHCRKSIPTAQLPP